MIAQRGLARLSCTRLPAFRGRKLVVKTGRLVLWGEDAVGFSGKFRQVHRLLMAYILFLKFWGKTCLLFFLFLAFLR